MAKVHINTDDCEEIARRLSAISGSLTGLAGNIRSTCSSLVNSAPVYSLIATKNSVAGVPWACTSAEITAATVALRSSKSAKKIDSIAEKLKKASDCIYQSVKLYNSAEKNVSGFENWLVDEELRKLNQTKKDALDYVNRFINDNKETYKQSPYRIILDSTWFVTPITQFWDHVVRVDGEDILGLIGVDSESEEIILRMCRKKELSLSERAGDSFLGWTSDKSAFVDEYLSLIDEYDKLQRVLKNDEKYKSPLTKAGDSILGELHTKSNFPVSNMEELGNLTAFVKTASAIGEKEMAYNVLMDTVAFKSLKPVIEATGDQDLISTYYLMENKMDSGLLVATQEMTVSFIDKGMGKGMDMIIKQIPVVGKLKLAADITASGMDVLFRTSDTAEAHNLMLKCRDISDSLAVSVDKALSAYNSSPTPENYASLVNAVKARFEIEAVGNQYAYDSYQAMDQAWIKTEMAPEMMQLLEDYHGKESQIYNGILEFEKIQNMVSAILQREKP